MDKIKTPGEQLVGHASLLWQPLSPSARHRLTASASTSVIVGGLSSISFVIRPQVATALYITLIAKDVKDYRGLHPIKPLFRSPYPLKPFFRPPNP